MLGSRAAREFVPENRPSGVAPENNHHQTTEPPNISLDHSPRNDETPPSTNATLVSRVRVEGDLTPQSVLRPMMVVTSRRPELPSIRFSTQSPFVMESEVWPVQLDLDPLVGRRNTCSSVVSCGLPAPNKSRHWRVVHSLFGLKAFRATVLFLRSRTASLADGNDFR